MVEIRRWQFREPTDYMVGYLHDLHYEEVVQWITQENLTKREKREFAGFTLYASIDGGRILGREVTLGRIVGPSNHGQHVHRNSDAFIIVTRGAATLLMGDIQRVVAAPKLIRVPKGVSHGFRLNDGEWFEFVSVQYPPIRDEYTGEEDFHQVDHE